MYTIFLHSIKLYCGLSITTAVLTQHKKKTKIRDLYSKLFIMYWQNIKYATKYNEFVLLSYSLVDVMGNHSLN